MLWRVANPPQDAILPHIAIGLRHGGVAARLERRESHRLRSLFDHAPDMRGQLHSSILVVRKHVWSGTLF